MNAAGNFFWDSDQTLVNHALLVAAKLNIETEPQRSARLLLAELAKRLRLVKRKEPRTADHAVDMAVSFALGIATGILAAAVFYTFSIGPAQ